MCDATLHMAIAIRRFMFKVEHAFQLFLLFQEELHHPHLCLFLVQILSCSVLIISYNEVFFSSYISWMHALQVLVKIFPISDFFQSGLIQIWSELRLLTRPNHVKRFRL